MVYEYTRDWDIHQGVWFDIFPLARLQSKFEVRLKKLLLSLSNYFLMDNRISANRKSFKKTLGAFEMFLLNLFYLIPFSARQKLHNRAVKTVISRKRRYKYYGIIDTSIQHYFPKDVFEGESSKVLFNGREYSTVPDYDKYLRLHYGDYMTPVQDYKCEDMLIVDLNNSYEKYTSGRNGTS